MPKNWVYAARQGELGEVGKNQKPLTDLEIELVRIKRPAKGLILHSNWGSQYCAHDYRSY
jgi:transposase InsO family protein